MSKAMFVHKVQNIKAYEYAHEALGNKDKAESTREVLRMIERGTLRTLSQIEAEINKRDLEK